MYGRTITGQFPEFKNLKFKILNTKASKVESPSAKKPGTEISKDKTPNLKARNWKIWKSLEFGILSIRIFSRCVYI